MDEFEWRRLCSAITDAMREHTRPFVTSLSHRPGGHRKLFGSGSYIARKDQRFMLTCEHVARHPNLELRFWPGTTNYAVPTDFTLRPNPDLAWSDIPNEMWTGVEHNAVAIPYERFAPRHHVTNESEVMFFRGFAGENAHDDLVEFKTHGSGYCSQEKREVDKSDRIFEMFWEPGKTSISSGTSDEARETMKFENPGGFSGSLVWNTGFMEARQAGKQWDPSQASVTGIVIRHDQETSTLLVLRVEHIRAEIDSTVLA